MNKISFYDINNVLKGKESYYKGLLKGSHHDRKVAIYSLQAIASLRKDLERACK
jgi:hypothetical protein